MDKVTLVGPREIIANDVHSVIAEGILIRLCLNTDKSELITKAKCTN